MFFLANTHKKIATHAHHNHHHKEKKRKREKIRGGGEEKKPTGKRIEGMNKESSRR